MSGSTDHVRKNRVHWEDYVPLEWARAFPSEHIWKVRKATGVAS